MPAPPNEFVRTSMCAKPAKSAPRQSVRRRAGYFSYLLERPISGRHHVKENTMTTQSRVMNELSSRRRFGKPRSHAVISRAIGAGLFAAGVGLCVVLSHASDQSSVEVEACANNLCPSTFGSALSVVEGEAVRVAIGDPSDGVSAPLGGAGLDEVGIADEDPRRGVADPAGVGDPADGVSAPLNRTASDG
jgi:hypothetical protein